MKWLVPKVVEGARGQMDAQERRCD
jgi:hypothetical protein